MHKFISPILLTLSLMILASCGQESPSIADGTGGITAQAVWPAGQIYEKTETIRMKAPATVRWVKLLVSKGTTTLSSQEYDTLTTSSGSVSGVPAGSGWTLTIQGLDDSAPKNVLYQGSRTGLSITAGQTTNAGPISMQIVAQAGTLDKSFSLDGKLTSVDTPAVAGDETIKGLAIQPDGKIVVVGSSNIRSGGTGTSIMTIARYNTDGTIDTSFIDADNYAGKIQGLVTLNTPYPTRATDVVIQSDGKILVVGDGLIASNSGVFIAARFNSNGSWDSTFTAPTASFLATDIDVGPVGAETANALALERFIPPSSARFAVAGSSMGKMVLAVFSTQSGTAALLTKTTTTLSPSCASLTGKDVAIDTYSKFIVIGNCDFGGAMNHIAVTRFNVDGTTIDASFNGQGFYLFGGVSVASALAVQPDGKIIVVGGDQTSTYWRIIRLNSNGSLDTTFGLGTGSVSVDMGAIGSDTKIAVLPDGKIIVAGNEGLNVGAIRLNPDGTLDTTFGTNGKVSTTFSFTVRPTAMGIHSDGRIVIAGESMTGPPYYWAVARLWNSTTTGGKIAAVSGNVTGIMSTITSTVSNTYSWQGTLVATPTSTATSLGGIAVDPIANRIYISDTNGGIGNKVFVVDTINFSTLAAITVAAGPDRLLVEPGSNRLYVANYGALGVGTTVSVIDTSDNSVAAVITGLIGPRGLALNSEKDSLYVSNALGNSVSVIDTLTDTIVSSITGFDNPAGLAFDPITHKLFVANNGNGTISVVDTQTNTKSTDIPVGTGPLRMAIDPTASRLYVANNGTLSTIVSVISTTANTKLPDISVGGRPKGISIDAINKKLYVDTMSPTSTTYIIDVNSDGTSPLTTMMGGYPDLIVVP